MNFCMNFWNRAARIAVGALALVGVVSALPAQSPPPRAVVAVFSQEDAQFSEMITLYADGKYQQAETEKKSSLYGPKSMHDFGLPNGVPEAFPAPRRNGIWRVLDKEGGQPIVFKALASLPKDAVIEVKAAMPFGITWEHQIPYFSHGDRTLPASSFQAAPPAAPPPAIPTPFHPKIVIGRLTPIT